MYGMFWVSSSPLPPPPAICSRSPSSLCMHAVRAPRSRPPPLPPPDPQLVSHRVPCLRDRRQGARAFNQPLTFDLSSITDMSYIFNGAPLSAANRLLIRCAWAGSAFETPLQASVPFGTFPVYGSGWALGSCA